MKGADKVFYTKERSYITMAINVQAKCTAIEHPNIMLVNIKKAKINILDPFCLNEHFDFRVARSYFYKLHTNNRKFTV